MIKDILYMCICCFYYTSLNILFMHEYGTYYAYYYVNFSCYFVFTNTLIYVVYWQAHIDANYCNMHTTMIDEYQSDRGMNYNLKNYTAIYDRSQKWAQQEETVTTTQKIIKAMKENNSTLHDESSCMIYRVAHEMSYHWLCT